MKSERQSPEVILSPWEQTIERCLHARLHSHMVCYDCIRAYGIAYAAQETAVLLTALREAQQEPVITMTDGWNLKLSEVADAYDALQQRVEALEKAKVFECDCPGCPSCAPHICRNRAWRCAPCTKAALRGGETG